MRKLADAPAPSKSPDDKSEDDLAALPNAPEDMSVDPKPKGPQFYENSDANWYFMNSWGGFMDYSVYTQSYNPDEPSMTFWGQEFYASYGVDWHNFDLMTLRVEGFGGCIRGVVCIDGATEFTHPKHLSFRQDDFTAPFAVEEIKVPENFTEIVNQAFGDDDEKAGELLNRTTTPPPHGDAPHRNLAVRQERRLHSHEALLAKVPDCRVDSDCGSSNATCIVTDATSNSTEGGKCAFSCTVDSDCDRYAPFNPNKTEGIVCQHHSSIDGGFCFPRGLLEAMETESSYVNSTQETMYDYPSLKDKPQDLGIKIEFSKLFSAMKLEKPLPDSIMKEINEVLKDAQQEIGRIPVQFAPFQDPIGNKLLFNVDDAMALRKPLYKNVLQVKGDFPIDFPGATADYLRGSFWLDISLRLEGFVDEQFNPISSEKNLNVKMGFNIEFLDVSKMGWMHGAPGWQRIYETEMVDGQWLISRY